MNPKIDAYGNEEWFNEEGVLHRTDGPAIEYRDGLKYWYINGKMHREDGPAMITSNGYKIWCLNGVNHTEEEFLIQTRKKRIEILL
jgi:hypothetical protein